MTFYEYNQLLTDNRTLIADTWNFFLTVNIALIGLHLLPSFRKNVHLVSVIVLLAGYGVFMYINYRAQMDNYNYVFSLIDGMRAKFGNTDDLKERAILAQFQAGWIRQYLIYFYCGAAGATTSILLLSKAMGLRAAQHREGLH